MSALDDILEGLLGKPKQTSDQPDASLLGQRLYSPNPDAPTSYGSGYTPPPPSMWQRVKDAGSAVGSVFTPEGAKAADEWLSSPAGARTAATVGANMLPGASSAELPEAGGEFYKAQQRADPLGMATAGMKMGNSLLGAIPLVGALDRGALAVGKGAQSLLSGERTVAKIAKGTKNVQLPSLRTMPADDAIAIARQEPHLIKGGEGSEGLYVGGPRDVVTRRQLTQVRKDFDARLAENPIGGDWYDRYRASVGEVTGGDPVLNDWMTRQHGMWSAGVSPEGELGFALKENNANLAGLPVKAARPAQHEAQQAAIAAQDPGEYLLGKKTGQYQNKITPDQVGPPTAVGVNDFRQARAFGYTEPTGLPQSQGLKGPQHTFVDYEMALAVDRANKAQLGGRSDWTGEQLQAIPWVLQKGDDLYGRAVGVYRKDADREIAATERGGMMGHNGGPPMDPRKLTPEEKQAIYAKHEQLGRTEKLGEANKQIGDYFDKHTAFATHESRPGPATGHVPGLLDATPEEVAAYHADPASTWATAPGGRDAIYAGTQIPGTGVAMRTRPTLDMQGMYVPESGVPQFNEGQTARPLVAFNNEKTMAKVMPEADRSLLTAGETTRAVIDAQDAGAAHKPWIGGPAGKSNSAFIPLNRKLTPDEMVKLREVSHAHGLPDVVDTGQGVTLTHFSDAPPPMSRQTQASLAAKAKEVLPDMMKLRRAAVDSIYAPLTDAWKAGDYGGAPVTQALLDAVSKTPSLRAAFNANPHLAERAKAKMARDAAQGGAREGVQNVRSIVAGGPGWVDRLEAAKKAGKIALPGLLAPIVGGALLNGQDDPTSSSR